MRRGKFSLKLRNDFFLLLAYVVVSCVFLYFSSGGITANLREAGFSAFSRIQLGFYSIGSFFSGTVNAIKELSDLREKYALLEKRLEEYEAVQHSNITVRRENERLRKILSFSQAIPVKNISAEIIGRDPFSLYSGITVNKGARHGVKKDMPVISFQDTPYRGGLVGKVVQVGTSTCMIMPLYDLQCYVPSKMESSRFYGIVNGQGNRDLALVMRYVPKRAQEEIKTGELIVTSGENSTYLPDIAVGVVAGINSNDYENLIEIIVNPAIDFSRLDSVFILDTGHEESSDIAGTGEW